MTYEQTSALPVLEANARSLRRVYMGISLLSLGGSTLFAAWVASGGRIEGPAIAVAVFLSGMLIVGLGLLVFRRYHDRAIAHALLQNPSSIKRVFPKRTESALYGATVATYRWIVLELTNGRRLDIYAKVSDFTSILSEIHRAAPDAEYDPAWKVERYNVRIH
jgi:hypothetical protein